jgi:hypothetical protein
MRKAVESGDDHDEVSTSETIIVEGAITATTDPTEDDGEGTAEPLTGLDDSGPETSPRQTNASTVDIHIDIVDPVRPVDDVLVRARKSEESPVTTMTVNELDGAGSFSRGRNKPYLLWSRPRLVVEAGSEA